MSPKGTWWQPGNSAPKPSRNSLPPLRDSAPGAEAVKPVIRVDDAGSLCRVSRELDRRLDRLRARVEKKHRWRPSCVLATNASASSPGSSAASS